MTESEDRVNRVRLRRGPAHAERASLSFWKRRIKNGEEISSILWYDGSIKNRRFCGGFGESCLEGAKKDSRIPLGGRKDREFCFIGNGNKRQGLKGG